MQTEIDLNESKQVWGAVHTKIDLRSILVCFEKVFTLI